MQRHIICRSLHQNLYSIAHPTFDAIITFRCNVLGKHRLSVALHYQVLRSRSKFHVNWVYINRSCSMSRNSRWFILLTAAALSLRTRTVDPMYTIIKPYQYSTRYTILVRNSFYFYTNCRVRRSCRFPLPTPSTVPRAPKLSTDGAPFPSWLRLPLVPSLSR